MDVDAFRMASPLPVTTGSCATNRRRKRSAADRFLAGPVPMWWLARAYRAGAAAQAVGLALWHVRGIQRGREAPIKVNAASRRSMGLSQDQARRGVRSLEEAGLLKIERGGRGRCAVVTIVVGQLDRESLAGTGEPL